MYVTLSKLALQLALHALVSFVHLVLLTVVRPLLFHRLAEGPFPQDGG